MLTTQKSFQKNIKVDRSLKHVEMSMESIQVANGAKESQISVYSNKHIQMQQNKIKNMSPGKSQLNTMPAPQ